MTATTMNEQDRGYAYVILVAAFVAQILQCGVTWTVGVFYAIFVEVFPESSGTIAGISSLNTASFYAAGPLASYLTNKYGCRAVIMLGGFLGSIGLLLSMYAENVYTLFVTFGLMTGFGLGLSYLPSITILGDYFNKWRAIAIGFVASGIGVGQFTHPPLIRYFVNEYGWRGSLLMLAGVSLNICVCGALCKPFKDYPSTSATYNKNTEVDGSAKEDDQETHINPPVGDDTKIVNTSNESLDNVSDNNCCESNCNKSKCNIGSNSMYPNLTNDKCRSTFQVGTASNLKPQTLSTAMNSNVICPKILLPDVNNDAIYSPGRPSVPRHYKHYKSSEVINTPMFSNFGSSNCVSNYSPFPMSKSTNFGHKTIWSCHNLSSSIPSKSTNIPSKATENGFRNMPIYKPLAHVNNSSNNFNLDLQRSVLLNEHHKQQYQCSNYSLASLHKNQPIYSSVESVVSHFTLANDYINDFDTYYEQKGNGCDPGKNDNINLFILKNPKYLLLCINNFGLCFALSIISVHLAAYASSYGISTDDSAMLFTVIGLANFIGRLSFGLFAQKKFTKEIVMYSVSFGLAGIFTTVCPFYTDFYWLVIFAVLYGFLTGCFGTLLPGIMIDIVEIQYLSSAYGYMLVFEAVGTLIGAPTAGWLYEATGDYGSSLYLGGTFILISSLILVIPSLCKKIGRCKPKENEQYINVLMKA